MENDPFIGLKFNDAPYKAALDKVNSSFDSTITEAATEAGMAAGMGGGNVATVGADAYVKAASQRNNAEASLLNAKAGAEASFNSERDFKSAEWKANQAGPLDWITTGLSIAGTTAATVMTGGAAVPSLIAGAGKLIASSPANKNSTTMVNQNGSNLNTLSLDKTETPKSSEGFMLEPIKLKLKPKKTENISWLK